METLTLNEAAEYIGCSASALRLWHRQGRGPMRYRAGKRIKYQKAALDAWIASNTERGQNR